MANPFPGVVDLPSVPIPISDGKSFKVHYLAPYYPKSTGALANEVDSVRLLELKDGGNAGIRHYAAKLQTALLGSRQAAVIVMPSHSVGSAAATGGLRMALKTIQGVADLSACLVRHTAVAKAARAAPGQRPTAENHRDSMQIADQNRIQSQDILLLDDVVTRGASMRGARFVILQAGAKSVTCLSLTRTMYSTPNSEPDEHVIPF
jgi:phosphoribosylpyrophosphate synthetase